MAEERVQRRLAAIMAAAVVGYSLLTCIALTVATSVYAAEPVRIGVSLGLTGRYAKLAAMQERGYRLWEKEINKKGGILGRPVKVLIKDDGSKGKAAQAAYRTLIKNERVDLVFGPFSSAITLSVAPVVDGLGYPMLAPGAASDKIWQPCRKNIFGMWTPASRYSVGIFKLALLNNLKKVGIVFADDPFSVSVGSGAKKWAPRLGLKVVVFEKFKKFTKDLTALARKARDSGVELLVVGGHFRASVDMRLSMDRIGWYPKAYFATIGPVQHLYKKTLGQKAEFSLATSIWEPHEKLNFPKSREFVTRFSKMHQRTPTYQAATAYAAGQIIETAVHRAGSLRPDKVRQALFDLDTYSIIGRYAVNKCGMQVKRFPLTIQWQGGKKEIVWPKDLRTKELIIR